MPTYEGKEGFSSNEILSQAINASGGYSRPHQYEAIITPPSRLQFDSVALKRISMNCSSTAIPGRTFGVKNQENGGQITREIPHTVFFQEIPLNFYLSTDLLEKRLFDHWQSMIYDPSTGNFEYPSEYFGTVTLIKHVKNGGAAPVASFELMDAWPKLVGEVTQSYDGMNQISILPVVITYWQFKSEYLAPASNIIDDSNTSSPNVPGNPIRTA